MMMNSHYAVGQHPPKPGATPCLLIGIGLGYLFSTLRFPLTDILTKDYDFAFVPIIVATSAGALG
jgi:hypothetical protein